MVHRVKGETLFDLYEGKDACNLVQTQASVIRQPHVGLGLV